MGIVGKVRHLGLDREPPSHVYQPLAQLGSPPSRLMLAVRGQSDPAGLRTGIRSIIASVAPDVAVSNVKMMEQVVAESVMDRGLNTALLGVFAAMALAMVSAGIYGVMSFLVSRRTPEIGVRMALGATATGVLGMVIGTSLKPVLAGLVLGAAGALAGGRLLQPMLFGIPAHDPLTLSAVCLVMLAVAMLASWIPARRAASVDPAETLRSE